MSKEVESIRAAAAEAAETVVLTREFYSCIVKDARTKSGQFHAVKLPALAKLPTPAEGFMCAAIRAEKNSSG